VDAYTKAETDTKLGAKADQTTVDELETTKADQTTVDELETTKADQTTVDADAAALRALADAMQTPLTIDSDNGVGLNTSIAIGDNGNPVISYYDNTNGDLKVAACTNPGCTGTPTITTIDSDGNVGRYTSIAIGDNGYPVISYYDFTNDDLKVAACTTADCTGTPTITTVDSDGNVGRYTSIAIGNGGNPVISHWDFTNDDLKVAACTATDCSGTPTITTVDSDGDVGYYTSIAIGDNDNPVISYDSANGDLKVAACTTTDCTGTPTITTVDSDGDVGYFKSIAIGDNGYPIISYYDASNDDLKVAACTTTDCSGTPTITTVDSDGDVGYYTSIAIGSNGYPIISYWDVTNDDLKAAACTTTGCTGTPTITILDSINDVGRDSSIAIGSNSNPIISYYDSTNGALKVAAMWHLELPQ
jgi:20S proteasome alpha/beta subunit